MDKTKHDYSKEHGGGILKKIPHSKAWYSLFGDKCPICGASAK